MNLSTRSELYLSAKEIAETGVIASYKLGVTRFIAKHTEILSRPSVKQGGEYLEYDVLTFPEPVRTQLLAKLQGPPTPQNENIQLIVQSLWRQWESKSSSDKKKAKAQRKVKCLLRVAELVANGLTRMDSLAQAARENGRKNWKIIYAWEKAVKHLPESAWAPALLDFRGGSQNRTSFPRYLQIALPQYLRIEAPTLTKAHLEGVKRCQHEGVEHPSSEKWLARYIKKNIPREQVVLKREGEKACAALFPHQEMDYGHLQSGQAVCVDWQRGSYPGEEPIRVLYEDGTEQQVIQISICDIRSRKILYCEPVRSENADEFRLSFGAMYDATGIWPELINGDNSRAISAKQNSGGVSARFRFHRKEDDIVGIFELLGTKIRFSIPENPQAKVIERANRDFRSDLFKDVRLTVYRGKAIPIAEYRRILADFVLEFNAKKGRRGKGADGKSYDEIYSENLPAVRKVLTAEQRRLLDLGATKIRCSREDGAIHFLGNRFWCEKLLKYAGSFLTVRYDPNHLQRGIVAYEMNGVLISEIPWLPSVGYGDVATARTFNRTKRAFIKKQKAGVEDLKLMKAIELAKLVPQHPSPEPQTPSNVVAPRFERAVELPSQDTRSEERRRSREQLDAAMDQLWEEQQAKSKMRRIR